ncbi:putative transmembrane protein [Winogradskyella psychrotolerans RS-3]|uniref:Putative transmembrane protein n=1 Tax=Winogradskyella psychrotolerans RS-3 TaxID=641526 RepID=S7VTH9_9FLAO|nr:YoaK family protein [Winogradskyella psychrotolerans]EPR73555.1 putative transmembrane protein [Winogradskyella psychrotolerans RS-3]
MFRHQGKSRTLTHNLRIAIILSFVAGIVNVTGFLAFKQLTTNVTGHFALFIDDVANFEFWKGTIYFLYIFSFLFGSFSSSFLIEKYRENKRLNVFALPTIIECLILITVGILSNFVAIKYPDLIICTLLFAMGLQNSFVTKISNAVVRTTHLTGLFTDLGIDISQLFFAKYNPKKEKLKSNIKLRIYIILFFFAGGLAGGFFYSKVNLKLNTLIIGAFILLISLFYDDFRYKLIKTRRKYHQKKKKSFKKKNNGLTFAKL